MVEADGAIREEFVAEAGEHVLRVEESLAEVAERDAGDARSAVHSIFRAFHSIKGCANCLGLEAIARLCHEEETLLSLARNGDIALGPPLWDLVAEGACLLGAMLEDLDRSGEIELGPLLARIRATVREGVSDGAVAHMADTPLIVRFRKVPIALEARLYGAQKALEAGHRLFLLRLDLVRECDGKGRSPFELLEWLNGVGDVLAVGVDPEFVPDLFESNDVSVPFFVLYATLAEPGVLAAAGDLDPACAMPLVRAGENVFDAEEPEADRRATPSAAASIPPFAPTPDPPARALERIEPAATAGRGADPPSIPRSVRSAAATIRVNVEILDRLVRLSGELVAAGEMAARAAGDGDLRGFGRSARRVRSLAAEIRRAVLRSRMQPAGSLFRRFPPLARDLARELRKEVEVEIEGGEIELDRAAIEALADPLAHLVRNAVDHGIEPPDARRAAGKPPAGRLALRARRSGGQILVEVEDDGRGIDLARVREKAVSLSLLEREAAADFSPRRVLDLVFQPGLSTAEDVTRISGRGVGLDVVKTNVERIGGTVDVASEAGRGTTFRLAIPAGPVFFQAAIVRSGRSWLGIPASAILGFVRIGRHAHSRIARVAGAEILRLADGTVPIVRLPGIEPGEGGAGGERFAAVVRARAGRYALLADEIEGLREIIASPFGGALCGAPPFSGACSLGDERVALVLDVDRVAEGAGLPPSEGEGEAQAEEATARVARDGGETRLLFFDSPSAPGQTFAIPFSLVEGIELVDPSAIERIGGRAVLRGRGRAIPIGSLDEEARLAPFVPIHRAPAIRVAADGDAWAILAGRVRDAPADLRPVAFGRALPRAIARLCATEGGLVRVIDPARIRAAPSGASGDDPDGGGSDGEGAPEAGALDRVAGAP